MTEPASKRQRIDAAARNCSSGGCEDLEKAARARCLACLHTFVSVEPPLSREAIESAVKHGAGRSSWCCRAHHELDCCGSVNILLTAAAAATRANSERRSDLSCEVAKACRMRCLRCTLALLRYLDTHLGESW
jgi:hypothetical protein